MKNINKVVYKCIYNWHNEKSPIESIIKKSFCNTIIELIEANNKKIYIKKRTFC